ncbi:MAG: hypothetical protein WD066_05635 [Planctomycetaceae bacterium]
MAYSFRVRSWATLLSAIIALATITAGARGESTGELLAAVKRVGPEGAGHAEAIAAVAELQRRGAENLLPILRGFRDANPLAANWLSGAFESIADRTLTGGGELPAREIEAFVVDTAQAPAARQLAFDWLERVDATSRARLIPAMLDDPAPGLRREAVAHQIARAERFEKEQAAAEALAAWREAFRGAVHVDQVKRIVKALEERGEPVSVPEHLGFLTEWKIVGPFEHADGVGFDAVYPPEKAVDFAADYDGKTGRVAWRTVATEDDFGLVDIAKRIAPHKGAAMYAAADFHSDEARAAEIRIGTPNAWKLWVNGEVVFSRVEYHRGMTVDQYRVPVRLKAGANRILLKICQNEQTEDWAQSYEFQLRVCDRSGTGLRSARRGNGG